MKRLVYRPKVWAYVKTDSQAIDLSPYIVSGNVNRITNGVSTASLILRNPDFKFTTPGAPAFHPMDPITIYMARNINYPVRVFTGFLDTTPYLQLFPGTITLEASCTMKRLKYTYWDPALPFSKTFLSKFGWQQMTDGSAIKLDKEALAPLSQKNPELNDGGFSSILYGVLEAVGKWRQEDIFIEALPPGVIDTVTKVFTSFQQENEETQEALKEFLKNAIGETAAGASAPATNGTGSNPDYGKPNGKPKFKDGQKVKATVYGPPWDAVEGGPETATGVKLPGPTNKQSMDGPYIIASDPNWIPYHNKVYVWPNPFNYRGTFSCEDTGGAFLGTTGKIDIFDPRGTGVKDTWTKSVQIWDAANGDPWSKPNRRESSGSSSEAPTPTPRRGPAPGRSHKSSVRVASIDDMVGRDIVDAATTVIESSIPVVRSSRKTVTATPSARPISPSLPGGLTPQPNQSGRGPTPSDPNRPSNSNKPLWPVPTGVPAGNSGSQFGADRGGRLHEGLDFPCPNGTDIFAVLDGIATIVQTDSGGYGKWIELKHANEVFTRYGHLNSFNVKVGDKVKKGDVIAKSNNTGGSTGPHLHFEYRPGGTPQDPASWLAGADTQAGGTDPIAGISSGGGVSKESAQGIATASAFATQIELPTMAETLESMAYSGQKSYMNDKPLIDFVEQLCTASMRTYMSLPDGRFYAFFPDHFGTFNPNRPPYWEIDDVELIEGDMVLSDDNLKTHVYVVGDNQYDMKVDFNDRLMTSGIVTIFNAFETNWLLSQQGGKGKLPLFKDAASFLNRYGVRPDYHEEPMIRSKYFEAFSAFQRFMQQWSMQFITQFQFTFMPELYPGGRVAFKDHDLVCYVDSVQHQFDYTGGFETFAQLTSPSAQDTNNDGMMEKFTYGMVKSF
jgi:murein DD-endopeptidase MepM/ murein hydrolase activator NlpD/3D (Asp-Asp-Asp) domain-containing protein